MSYLALLPLTIRKELLNRLPVADVCLLEETPFVDGLDVQAYWRHYPSGRLHESYEGKWGPLATVLLRRSGKMYRISTTV